jgi:hypothetical protein
MKIRIYDNPDGTANIRVERWAGKQLVGHKQAKNVVPENVGKVAGELCAQLRPTAIAKQI